VSRSHPLRPNARAAQGAVRITRFAVSIKPEMPVGGFNPLTIKTDILQRDSQGEVKNY